MFGVFIALTIFAFIGGSYFGEKIYSKETENVEARVMSAVSKVENESGGSKESNEVKVDVVVESKSQETNKTTKKPTSGQSIDKFLYPGSVVVKSEASSLFLRSLDDSEKITDWYKSKIKSEDLSATSFVNTNTNGKVLNKLVADGVYHVEVEVSKDRDSQVEITVTTSN